MPEKALIPFTACEALRAGYC